MSDDTCTPWTMAAGIRTVDVSLLTWQRIARALCGIARPLWSSAFGRRRVTDLVAHGIVAHQPLVRRVTNVLNRIDSFFTRVVTAAPFFSIDFDRQFPPGSQIHATTSLSSISPVGGNPQYFAIASVVSFSVHLAGGGEGPRVFVPSDRQAFISVGNCARITFRLNCGRADAQSLINIYTF